MTNNMSDYEYQRERDRQIDNQENKGMSTGEFAYRAVLAVQEEGKRAEREAMRSSPVITSGKRTPMIVWGAMLGLLVGAFSGGASSGFIGGLGIMFVSMAIGAGLGWGIGKLFRLCFVTLPAMLFGSLSKVAKGEPREPPV